MTNLNIPVGISDFEKIRNNGFYYVDKSGLIAEIFKDEPTEVTLITRPHRFGKTLGMSMLKSFFDIRKDNKELFEGLEISENTSLCKEWMNQWPTIFFTLKDIDGLNFDEAYGQLAAQISNLFKEYTYLLDSENVDIDDKKTKVRNEELEKTLPENILALQIPNAEIREIFETTVVKWFDDSAKIWNRRELFTAVWNKDSEKLTEEMNKLLRKTISYHDYREDFYHAFLAGIFAGAGYIVESNKEHGEGRSDVVVYDSVNSRVAVFEAKYAASLDEMGQKCEEALHQIDKRMYAKEFEDEYDHILCYGISFFKKRCRIRIK